MAKATRRKLSSIDLLPEEAMPDVQWAYEALKVRRATQIEILDEFNKRLADRGLKGISKSAFNRRALWIIAQGDAILKAREIAAILGEKLDQAPEGDVGVLLNELIKSLVYDIIANAQLTDKVSMNMMLNAAVALDKLENAKKLSVDSRAKIAKEFASKATVAIEQAGRAKGLSEETIIDIKSKVLGIDLAKKS